MQDLKLPRRRERKIVYDPRDREYTLRGSETRTLSTVGLFRSHLHEISATTWTGRPTLAAAISVACGSRGPVWGNAAAN
jgi:hypothetical protein